MPLQKDVINQHDILDKKKNKYNKNYAIQRMPK